MFVFVFIPGFAPEGMVAVLLAAPGITSSNLHMAIGIGADPYLAPRRRDHERLDASQRRLVFDGLPRGIDITKSPAQALPPDSRLRVAYVAQSDLARRLHGRLPVGNDRAGLNLARTPAAPGPQRSRTGGGHITRGVGTSFAAFVFSASLPSPCRIPPSTA